MSSPHPENPHPENLSLDLLIGTAVNNADEEFVGTVKDIFVNRAGEITAILLETGGLLGVGKNSVVVPFAMCSISVRGETPVIILSQLHTGEAIVAPEYQVPGGTSFERVTSEASTLGEAAMTKAGELSDKAADKTAQLGQKAVAWAAVMAHKGADKVTELVHRDDDQPPTQHKGGAAPGSPGPGPYDPNPFPGPHNPNPVPGPHNPNPVPGPRNPNTVPDPSNPKPTTPPQMPPTKSSKAI